jgi:8-oxo-dGTP pyrophosphatase MutT (NUDIX family)
MSKAVRAIIIEGDKILVMHRNKEGSQYFTLVGGRVNDGESLEAAIKREVQEETGLEVTESRHVYTELHPEPYNEQYIFVCKIAPHNNQIAIQPGSEEAMLNTFITNIHTPLWVYAKSFGTLPFRTPQLQTAIVLGLKKGFPSRPIQL